MLLGFFSIESDGEYGPLYDELQEKYPGTYEYDYHTFTGLNTAGCFSSTDAPLNLLRAKQLEHYWKILKDKNENNENRLAAAQMLGRLNAVEYFTKLVGMGYKIYKKGGKFNALMPVFGQIQAIAEKLDERDQEQVKLKKWFSKISDKKPKDKPISFGRFAVSVSAALQGAKEILTSEEIFALFSTIAEKCGRYTDDAFSALPEVLRSKKTPEAILASQEIKRFFR